MDLAPLLLTIGSGGNDWRSEPHYSHLAERLDLAAILADPAAPGRDFVLHATDETVTEFAARGVRGRGAAARRRAAHPGGQVRDLLALGRRRDRAGQRRARKPSSTTTRTASGRLELHNDAGQSPLEDQMREKLHRAFSEELRRPLPSRLGAAHGRGFADYFSTARGVAAKAATRRRERVESSIGDLDAGRGRTAAARVARGSALPGRRKRRERRR